MSKLPSLSPHPDFELLKHREIAAMKLQVVEFRHRGTGAVHIHLAAPWNENVFMVVLRTIPEDSSGVAHILEHTALCGSERFPVRDPFFMMLRRSLNTFMNAFTGSDWTAYPFATCNRKDFNNLLEVYLNAVFFARLDPLDFAQEGHRVEFSEPDNPNSELIYRGVVFNEMKGAMSTPQDQVYHTLCRHLYPTTTYRHNSGGDPAAITALTHTQLLNFYRRHYHPSNATFMTFGDIPPAEHQQQFSEQVLKRFERGDCDLIVPREQRFKVPVEAEGRYSLGEENTGGDIDRTHIVMSWLLGESTDLEHQGEASLMNAVLLDNSASPLRQALEQTELGKAPSSLCGLMSEHRELVFCCGLEDSRIEHAEAVQALILDTLQQTVKDGVDREIVESVLYQFELQRRRISGGAMPYGLQCLLSCLNATLFRGDPAAALDLDQRLKTLRQRSENPDFIPSLIQELLLDNPHRLRLVMQPDAQRLKLQQEAEKQQLARIAAGLNEQQRQELVSKAALLDRRQQQSDPPDILPSLKLSDVPDKIPVLKPHYGTPGESAHCGYQAATNGLVYQQLILKLPELQQQELELLPLLTDFMTEVGIGKENYLTVQRQQARVSGNITASCSFNGGLGDEQHTEAHLCIAAMGLKASHGEMSKLVADMLWHARFDELERLRELVAFTRNSIEQQVTGHGHLLAMQAAMSGMSPAADLKHRLGGLSAINRLQALDRKLSEGDQLEQFSQQLSDVHRKLTAMPVASLLICEEKDISSCREVLTESLAAHNGEIQAQLQLQSLRKPMAQLWQADSQVNFCARAWPAVTWEHPDAPVLAVLAEYLRFGYLHRSIRESGGAYGGGARFNPNAAAFCCFSYRDPRRSETLADFDRALEWLESGKAPPELLNEAILSVIASLDKPDSPAGNASNDFFQRLAGNSPERRRQWRQAVLSTSTADLQRTGSRWLRPEKASTAVIAPRGEGEELLAQGLELFSV